MPEGPEVKLTTKFLMSCLENKIIYDWNFTSGQYINKQPKGYQEFEQELPLMISEVRCKGKFIWFHCFNQNKSFYILHSMRLTGSWRFVDGPSCRWCIRTEDGMLYFHDARCLATLEFTQDENVLNKYLKKLGPDIMSDDFTPKVWDKLIQRYANKNVTAFLMNQDILSGCGNYIKAECLYRSRISPLRKLSDLSKDESKLLYQALQRVPAESYLAKGMTIRDYTDEKGEKTCGSSSLLIYGKKHATKTKTADGRVTHWDPEVQK